MSSIFTIQLNNLRFFAGHGVFAEEARAGNEFEVNLSLTLPAPETKPTSLEETINYAEVYRITKALFSIRKKLLETLAMEIAAELKQHFPAVTEISVQINKLHPPISAFAGSVSVTYQKSFTE